MGFVAVVVVGIVDRGAVGHGRTVGVYDTRVVARGACLTGARGAELCDGAVRPSDRV